MLLLQLFEKMSLIALAAYIFSQTRMFNNLIKDEVELRDKFIMTLFFSSAAIIGTYIGIHVDPHAYANTRPVAVITAGYIGGPVVGLIVAAVAGMHRYSLGGFTAFSCGIASLFEALAGVAARKYSKGNKFNILAALFAGLIGEISQIVIILIFARPLQSALELERVIAIPMVFVNTIGVMIFVKIIENAREVYILNSLAQEAYTAELKALRSQIHPHFLFNALNTIASFCRTNPVKARELIIDLSNFFRTTLKREEDFIPLKDEISLIESYMAIEKARFGERVNLHLDIDKNLSDLKVPVFVLQPLVENCIKHGLSPKVEGGSIYVRIKEELSKVIFTVEDTGCGIAEEDCKDILRKGNGIGLKNINERLKLIYGNKYGLTIKSKLNLGTIVEFSIPKGGV